MSAALLTQGSASGPPPAPQEPNWQTALSGTMLTTQAAGTLAGSGSVSPDGAYIYRLPIRVPPGRLDMAPNIELSYSSRAGNGPVGLGWSISGLSNITRCRRTLAHEEAAEGVLFDATDRFCLDGQKLEIITGTYGGAGAEYRTERFSGSKITSAGGGLNTGEPGSFEVRTSNGRILSYGTGAAARFSARYRPVWGDATTSGNAIYGWLLSSDRDRFGNAITYDYTAVGVLDQAEVNAQRKLTQIRYTANDGAGLAATRLVRFVYETRPDGVTQWVSGMKLTSLERLARIEVLGPKVPDGQPEILWTYAITYEQSPSAGWSRISSIQWCDATAGCLPATRFKWGPSNGFAEGPAAPKYQELWRNPQRLKLSSVDWTQVHLVDINGDGRDDLIYNPLHPREVVTNTEEVHHNMKARLSTGQGFGDELSIDRFDSYVEGNRDGGFDQYKSRFADFDGDGRMDLLAFANHQQATSWDPNSLGWRIYTFDNGAWVPTSTLHIPAYVGPKPPRLRDELQLADVDGDGLTDILIERGGSQLSVRHNRGYFGFGAEVPLTGAQLGDDWSYPTDINGDGRTEIVNLAHGDPDDPDNWPDSWGLQPFADPPPNYVLPNGFPFSIDAAKYRPKTFKAGGNGVSIAFYSARALADMTGDGLEDLISVRNDGIKVYTSTGRGLSTAAPWFGALTSKPEGSVLPDRLAGGVIPADFNGDGVNDLLILETSDFRFQLGGGVNASVVISSQTPTMLISSAGFSFRQVEGFAAPQAGYRVRTWGPFHRGPVWSGTTVGDIDGDGVPEIAQLERRHQAETEAWIDGEYELVVYSQRPASQPTMGLVGETLTEVTNGMGLVEDVSYRPLTDPETYTPSNTCSLPQRCLKRGLWVVRHHRLSNPGDPSEPDRSFYFKYRDGRTDIRGRGFLGFRCVTSVDIVRNREVTTCYRQDEAVDIPVKKACPGYAYPYASLPSSMTVKQAVEGSLFRFSRTEYKYDNPPVWGPGYTFRTHLRELEERVAEGPEGTLLVPGSAANQQVRRVSYTYDSDGNLREQYTRLHEKNDPTPQFEERRFNTWFSVDTTQWLMSRLQSAEVQMTRRNEQMRKRITDYEYVPNTQAVSKETVRRADDTQDVDLSTVYTREPSGPVKTITRTDGFGNVRVDKIDYDPAKIFPRRLENALGHVTWVGHHPATGDLVFTRDPNRSEQLWHYDWAGRLRTYGGSDGTALDYNYGRAGQLAAQLAAHIPDGPLAVLTTGRPGPDRLSSIDAWGRVTANVRRAADNTLTKTTAIYDLLGRTTFRSLPYPDTGAPAGTYQFSYDLLDRPKSVRNPDNSEKVWTYPNFFESTLTDEGAGSAGSSTVRTLYDATGNVKQVFRDPAGANIRTDAFYDSLGNLTRVVRNAGATDSITIEQGFDTLGRATRHTDPDRGTFTYKYNGHGNVRELTHEGVSTAVIGTDALGRVTSATATPVGGVAETTEFAYDQPGYGADPAQRGTGEVGALTSSLSADGVTTKHSFDAIGRSVRNCWTIRNTEDCVERGYTAANAVTPGALASLKYPNRPWKANETQPLRVSIDYDTSDASLAVVQNVSTLYQYWRAVTRSPEGLLTQARLGPLDFVSQFDETTRRLEDLTVGSGGAERMHLRYTYYPNGNVKTREDVTNGFTDAFDFDRLNQLSRWSATGNRAVTERYDYDRFGDILSTRNATTNQLLDDYALGRTDNAGPQAVTRLAEGGTGDVFTYKYDLAKRQVERNRNGQPWQRVAYTHFDLPHAITSRVGTTDVTTTFLYDAFHTRVYKSAGTDSTTYVAGLYERRVRGTQTTHVYYVPGESGPVAQVEFDEGPKTQRTLLLNADPLGSNSVVTNDAGQLVEQLYYSTFGRRINRAGAVVAAPTSSVRLGFTGQEHDDDLSLVNMRGRMYDPRLRRFTTPDPIGHQHPYSYVINNPLRYIDPMGFYGEDNRGPQSGPPPGYGGPPPGYGGAPPSYTITSSGADSQTRGPDGTIMVSEVTITATQNMGVDDRARTPAAGPSSGGPNGPTGPTGPGQGYGPNTGGYDPSYGSYSPGNATGAGSHAPSIGPGPPASPRSENAQGLALNQDRLDFAQRQVGLYGAITGVADVFRTLAQERWMITVNKVMAANNLIPAGIPPTIKQVGKFMNEGEFKAMGKVSSAVSVAGLTVSALGFAQAVARDDKGEMVKNGGDFAAGAIGFAGPLGATFSTSYALTTMAADVAWDHSTGFQSFELGVGGGIVTGLQCIGIDLLK